jgi:hypothetical protein
MEAPTYSYEEARGLIQNGDCISFISRDDNFLHNLTKKVTKSDYYHSGIAVWLSSPGGIQRLFVCEAHRAGRRLVPLSMYQGAWLDVKQCPVNFMDMEASLLTKVGQVDYGFADYILVGMRILFGVRVGDDAGEICSELVQDEYAKAGFEMPEYVLSPGELDRYLSSKGVPDRVFIR